MKRWPLGFLLVLALSAHAESFWDGNAAVQRGDAAFEAGLYAVSNAFVRDTEIVIEDLATGKTTTARVTGRLDEQLDILVLLSPAAALPLGLAPGDIVHVRVTIKKVADAGAPILAEDTAPSADPDRVPPAVRREETVVEAVEAEPVAATSPVEPAVETEPEVAAAPVEEPVVEAAAPAALVEQPAPEAAAPAALVEQPAPEAAAAVPVEQPAPEAAAAAPAETTVTSAEDAALLAELAARSPQKQLFLPPREDEMFAYQEPVEPPAPEAAIEVVAQPEETAPTTVEAAVASAPEIASDASPVEPEGMAEPIALAEAKPPAEMWPELVETLVVTAPSAEAEPAESLAEPAAAAEVVAASAPSAAPSAVPTTAPTAAPAAAATAEAAPAAAAPIAAAPAAKPSEAAPAASAAKPAAVATVLDLPGTGTFTWYLQLAAYTSEAMARDTAARLAVTYPVLVLAPQAGSKPFYRVFIGPLNRAECGTLLNYFRYRGFPDAFVRTAQK